MFFHQYIVPNGTLLCGNTKPPPMGYNNRSPLRKRWVKRNTYCFSIDFVLKIDKMLPYLQVVWEGGETSYVLSHGLCDESVKHKEL